MPKIRYIMLHYALLCLFLKNHYAYARGGIKCSFLCRHNSPMASRQNLLMTFKIEIKIERIHDFYSKRCDITSFISLC